MVIVGILKEAEETIHAIRAGRFATENIESLDSLRSLGVKKRREHRESV